MGIEACNILIMLLNSISGQTDRDDVLLVRDFRPQTTWFVAPFRRESQELSTYKSLTQMHLKHEEGRLLTLTSCAFEPFSFHGSPDKLAPCSSATDIQYSRIQGVCIESDIR